MNHDNIIFLDIETRRTRSNLITTYLQRGVEPDKRLKDPAKIAADLERKEAAAVADTPLQPLWGEIGCICWATEDGLVQEVYGDDERYCLEEFNDAIAARSRALRGRALLWCGFNVNFDLRFLFSRFLVHRIKPAVSLQHDAPPWSDKVIDLRAKLNGADRYAKGSLQDWMVALGNEPRWDDLPSSEVPDAFERGELAAVAAHCRQDVLDVIELYRRLF